MKYNSQKKEGKYDIFLEAKKLAAYTIHITSNEKYFPKKYRITVVAKLQELAVDIASNLTIANEIYPENRQELEIRISHAKKARAEVRALMMLVEVAAETFSIRAETFQYWTASASKLHRQTTKWIVADKNRFKKL